MKTIPVILSMLFFMACGAESSTDDIESSTDDIETSEVVPKEETRTTDANQDKAELSTVVTGMDEVIEETRSELEEPTTEIQAEVTEKLSEVVKTAKESLPATNQPKEIVELQEEPQPTNVPLKPNHDKWDALLKANVSSSGKVNYSGMKASKSELESYVKYLESFATRDSWTKNEKLAFWINLYNAATVRLIVQNYPVKSITDLSSGKPWDQNVVTVGNSKYSLNDIENNIIRPRFKDGRIHFAVNCAAKSCPPLMNKAFTAGSLSRYLEKQTAAFINSSANTIAADKVIISKIFDWYKVDFEGGDVISFLNIYSDTPINSDAEISYQEYNWELNK